MNINKLFTASLLLIIFLLASCSETEPIVNPEIPLIELEFSNSPIELQGVEARFVEDLFYDQYSKTNFDIYLPNSSSPTALVIFIHGGGFTGSDKQFIYSGEYTEQISEFLANDVAVATINYRLLEKNETEGVLKSLHDSKRAIQYIRYLHKELNIDKERITLFGTSAGGSTALWLATHDDFKDESHIDPVLHESTRVKGIALWATQSSLDIEGRWLGDVFNEFGSTLDNIIEEFGEETFFNFYGINSWEQYESSEIQEYRREVDMLSHLSADDPEIWVTNTGGHNLIPESSSSFNHHPFHARELKEYADAVSVPIVTTYGKPLIYSDAANEDFVDFLLRKLNE